MKTLSFHEKHGDQSSRVEIDEKYYADVDGAYGDGIDMWRYTSTGWGSEDVSEYNLYDGDGNLSPCRMLKGCRQRLRDYHNGNLRLYQNSINDRYMRMIERYAGNFKKPIKCKGLLASVSEFGTDFFSDVESIVSDRESVYGGHESYHRSKNRDNPRKKIAFSVKNGMIHFSRLNDSQEVAAYNLIRRYADCFIFPLRMGDSYAMKKRFGWINMRAGGNEKYEKMMAMLRKEYHDEMSNT